MEIRDRSVVVTGAAGGMGRTIVGMLIQEGASLALVDLSGEGLRELESRALDQGIRVLTQTTDVTDEDQVAAFSTRSRKGMDELTSSSTCPA